VNLAARAKADEVNPIEILRHRADALTQRAAALKTLADAWQPLFATLDENQKRRLKFLAVYVLREMRDAVETRRIMSEDEHEDDDQD
jgi:zinc resistance-associated protein